MDICTTSVFCDKRINDAQFFLCTQSPDTSGMHCQLDASVTVIFLVMFLYYKFSLVKKSTKLALCS